MIRQILLVIGFVAGVGVFLWAMIGGIAPLGLITLAAVVNLFVPLNFDHSLLPSFWEIVVRAGLGFSGAAIALIVTIGCAGRMSLATKQIGVVLGIGALAMFLIHLLFLPGATLEGSIWVCILLALLLFAVWIAPKRLAETENQKNYKNR